MHQPFLRYGIFLCLIGLAVFTNVSLSLADETVIHAVLFYSPSCGHCHQVINEVLSPLMEQYGTQFQIVGINVANPDGQAMYQAAIEQFSIPDERRGVPTLIIGDVVLVGSGEIPEQLPDLIETHTAQSGLVWPNIPGLLEALAEDATTSESTDNPSTDDTTVNVTTPTPTTTASANQATETGTPNLATGIPTEENTNWRVLFARDPVGNSISVTILVGMLISVLYNAATLRRIPSEAVQQRWQWAIPPLVLLGLVVAGYLAYVETQQVAAVCGPVGDCNAVQQSEFALLFGFLPIAVLGLMGYIAIGIAWAVARYTRGLWAELAKLAMAGMAWFGILFSIYLTFLEPFVIGATCAWCLTSAVLMTLLLWVITPLARPAICAVQGKVCVSTTKEIA